MKSNAYAKEKLNIINQNIAKRKGVRDLSF